MDERRRAYDKNWEDIKDFITESRQYRSNDVITQKYQVENIEALKNQVTKQNGRVFELEKWRQEIDIKIKQHKEESSNRQALISIVSAVVVAVAALIMIFKK